MEIPEGKGRRSDVACARLSSLLNACFLWRLFVIVQRCIFRCSPENSPCG